MHHSKSWGRKGSSPDWAYNPLFPARFEHQSGKKGENLNISHAADAAEPYPRKGTHNGIVEIAPMVVLGDADDFVANLNILISYEARCGKR